MKRREFLKSVAVAGSSLLCASDPALAGTIAQLKSAPGNAAASAIPNLDELAGDWIAAGAIDSLPSLTNFHGGLETSHNILGVQNFTMAPLAQASELAALSLDGAALSAQSYRWFPYQVLRKAQSNGFEIVTTVRMPFEAPGVLFSVDVTNLGKEPRTAALAVGFHCVMRAFPETWVWKTPRPEDKDAADFSSSVVAAKTGQIVLSQDSKSNCKSALAFLRGADEVSEAAREATWNLHLKPGESFRLQAVMAAGADLDAVVHQATEWSAHFPGVWSRAKAGWQQRFDAAFTPNNGHFSGNLPALATRDAKIRKLYYTSVLSLLCLERTNLSDRFPRVFVTGSPRYATTVLYFWDTSFFATVWALLDPLAMREQLKLFLESGIHSFYAIDFKTLQPIGRWYSANDYSVFRIVTTYVSVTHDWRFLDETLHGGQKMIDLLEALSLHWQTLAKAPSLLANYGVAKNLLETVPTYVQYVPAMNSANVWMMRSMAELRTRRGEAARAAQLKQLADRLAAEVLGLYVEGKGFWACRLEDGKRVEVRHCIDFFTFIGAMQSDLGQRRINEMIDFVDRELWTPHWLRALSLQDAAANLSLRPDHGSTGSYDAWPALTAEAMYRVGRKREALERLRSLEPATREGPFGQSHDVAAEQNPVRKGGAFGQEYFCSASGSFAEIILRTLFGFAPEAYQEWHSSQPTVPGFDGQLTNLRYGGKLLTL